MSKPTYWELLRDPQWQKKRLRIMERSKFECEECGSKTTTLNVHHSYYEKGLKPWEYPDESLHCLCEPCHVEAGDWRKAMDRQIGRLSAFGPHLLQELLGIAYALEMEQGGNEIAITPTSYEMITGMMRVWVTLGGRELDRYTSSAVSILDKDQKINSGILWSALDGVIEVDKTLGRTTCQMTYPPDKP
jgi:hypothetical protein